MSTVNPNKQIKAVTASAEIRQLDAMLKSSNFNPQMAGMILAGQQYQNEVERSRGLMQTATDNMKKQNYANQLNEQLATLKATRINTNGSAKDTDKVQITYRSEDRAAIEKAFSKIVPDPSDPQLKAVLDGKFSQTDLDSLSARVKTLSDEAQNQSQIDNMNVQNSNNRQNQFISFFMSMVDQLKTQGDRIFR